ncbi:MAG TPA: urease accessory UreF family protein [Streptosporangiaceae bacterium]|nr:urease accessory UreF family protein [Streptosporangiaceae bacterium]
MSTRPGAAPAGISRLMPVLQFGDSMLPIGSFAFSNGLESAVHEGVVHDGATLSEFAATAARRAATTDCVALLAAHRGADASNLGQIKTADRALFNNKLGEEARTMTVQMGRKLAELGSAVVPAPMLSQWLTEVTRHQTPGTYPVAMGVLFADLGSPEEDAFAVHQYGVAMTTLGAALRLMRIEPREVQAILRQMNTETEELYAAVRCTPLADMAGFAPMTDILAAMHVRAHVRMFMN